MSRTELRLLYPPSINHYWQSSYSFKRRRIFVCRSRKGKAYAADVEAAALNQLGRPPRLRGPLRITLRVTFPDRLKRDLDNLLKALLDALQHAGVYGDDNQLKDIWIFAAGVEKPGHVDVMLEVLDDLPLFNQVTPKRIREQTKDSFKPTN